MLFYFVICKYFHCMIIYIIEIFRNNYIRIFQLVICFFYIFYIMYDKFTNYLYIYIYIEYNCVEISFSTSIPSHLFIIVINIVYIFCYIIQVRHNHGQWLVLLASYHLLCGHTSLDYNASCHFANLVYILWQCVPWLPHT